MHNIKYIISVDDCFFARKREDMEAVVYSKMCMSLEAFTPILSSGEWAETVSEINDMRVIGVDASALIQSLVKSLEIEDLQKCYEVSEENGAAYT